MKRRRSLKTAAGIFVPTITGLVRAQPFTLNDPAFLAATRPVASASYTAETASFTGATQSTTRAGATATGTSKVGIFSFWINIASFSSQNDIFRDGAFNMLLVRLSTTGTLRFYLGATPFLDVTTIGTISANVWTHVLVAWDLNSATAQIYFNNVDASPSAGTRTNSAVDYSKNTPGFPYSGAAAINACIAELYWTKDNYLDISNATNRGKFNNGGSPPKPVSLGSDGSLPTGSQPIFYFKQGGTSWGTNAGSTANMTVTGTFGTCTAP